MIPIDRSLSEINCDFILDHSKKISWSQLTSLFKETLRSTGLHFNFNVDSQEYYAYMHGKTMIIRKYASSFKMLLDEGTKDNILVDRSLSVATTTKILLIQSLFKSLKNTVLNPPYDFLKLPKEPTDDIEFFASKKLAPIDILNKSRRRSVEGRLISIKKLSWNDIPESIILAFFTWVDIRGWNHLSLTNTMHRKMGQDARVIASLLNNNLILYGKNFKILFERAHPGFLERLNFRFLKVTVEELEKYFIKYPNIKELDLCGCKIDFTAVMVSKLPKGLIYLDLIGCKITAEGIANLPKGLRFLRLSNRVTPEIIANLPKGLITLHIYDCYKMSEKIIAGLPKKLESLAVTHTELTEQMIVKLPRGLTSLTVDDLRPKLIRKLPQSLTFLSFSKDLSLKKIDSLPEKLTSFEFFSLNDTNDKIKLLIKKLKFLKNLKLHTRESLIDVEVMEMLKARKIILKIAE